MKMYFNWVWILAFAIIGYAIYKHKNTVIETTQDTFKTVNDNLSQVTE